jgi:hypothetical protein
VRCVELRSHLRDHLGRALGHPAADLARRRRSPQLPGALAERGAELVRRRIALIERPRERPGHRQRDRQRDARIELVQRRDRSPPHHREGLHHVAAAEEAPPQQALPGDDAQREHVAPPVDRLALGLLGREIRELPLELAGRRRRAPQHRAGDAEVRDAGTAVDADQQVVGRHVAVDDAQLHPGGRHRLVGVVEPLRRLRQQLERDGERHPLVRPAAVAHQHRERRAHDELHHDVERAVVGPPEVERLHDVGARDVHREPGLVEEHVDELTVLDHVRQHPLHGHELLEPCLAAQPRREHLGHAARGDTEQRFVAPEMGQGLGEGGQRGGKRGSLGAEEDLGGLGAATIQRPSYRGDGPAGNEAMSSPPAPAPPHPLHLARGTGQIRVLMRSFQWRGAAALLAAFTLVGAACKEDRIALSIDLRTDYVPGREFVNVITEVVAEGAEPVSARRAAGESEAAFVEGTRVADFADLPAGSVSVKVRVMSLTNELLVERVARLSVSGDYALTMVVTRNCEGIVCPDPEGDLNRNTCNAGKCVEPGCLPEQPQFCLEPECAVDSDCVGDAACVATYCRAGTCLFVPDDAKCKQGQACDVTRGCHAVDGTDCKPQGATETICDDGVDDDCDGEIDCFDADCAGRACDDANECTTGETCEKSTCGGGKALACDDGEPCTSDACDPKKGCVNAPRTSGACDDGNACTEGDQCVSGHCKGGAAVACDDKNPCTDDKCDSDTGCAHVPNKASCDDGDACTTGDTCAAGACKPGAAVACDDKNPCTDDGCNAKSGCFSKSNAAACDDGVYCNGADTCASGICSVHAGDPCKMVCSEPGKTCVGCAVEGDCGQPTFGAWSDCAGFASTCSTAGTQSRTVTTPSCAAGACTNVVTTETQACTRATSGDSCGAVTYGAWSTCDYASTCDESASRSRQVHTPTCAADACSDVVTAEVEPCTRSTTGTTCQATAVGAWTACGGFANACDTTGTQTRQITTYTCASGACKAVKTSGSQACSRTVKNGTGCGASKYCCSGACYSMGDNNHCSSCGIKCNSGSCVAVGSGHYSCTCNNSNAQCVGDGFGPSATCYNSGAGQRCNCQCTGAGCCGGGADCFKPSGQNYCSY